MDIFDGQVLTGARSSTSNADTTGDASSGVSRAVFTSNPALYPSTTTVDIDGARYRATLMDGGKVTEYLLWAGSSGPLVVAPGTTSTNGAVAIPDGGITTGSYKDGTHRVVLTDQGGAGIASVSSVTVQYAGTGADIPEAFTFDPVSSTITFTVATVSAGRKDVIVATYIPGPATFDWTRNDQYATRFGWNGAHRKWEPYKGGAVKNLDQISSSGKYTITPVPTTATIGNPADPASYLPGTDTVGQYAMLRLGSAPDETSYPVVYRTSGAFSGILVVTDDQANTGYIFSVTTPPLAGVASSTTGKIAWNPAFVAAHDGEYIWYSPRDFEASSLGVVGSVLDTLFIAPIPGPVERPLLRFGQRTYLSVTTVADETALNALVVPSGSVGVALSTGKAKLNSTDTAKADPTSLTFDPLYLGVNLRYEGVAMNRWPQPIQAVSQLFLAGGFLYVPDATGLPGTGTSGIVKVPDGTGNTPNLTLPVGPRPIASGLVKRINPGFGDAFLFTETNRVTKLETVNFNSDLPTDVYSMPLDTAYVSLATGKVAVGASLASQLSGHNVYFSQCILTPSLYPDTARIFSRIRDTFTFTGTETFTFRVDGVNHTFTPTAGQGVPAATVATAITTATGVATGVVGGYLYIASAFATGTVGIGFNEDGCKALGFPPGWYVSNPSAGTKTATDPNWLPDTGAAFGLSRSPSNLDGSQTAPDVRATYRVTNTVLSDPVQSVPYQLLNYPPREDIAGYDQGIFFALNTKALEPWSDVIYQFDQARFGWLTPFSFAGQVEQPLSSIDLGAPGVVPATFYPAMGGGLSVSRAGGATQNLVLGTNFLVPDGSGTAILISRVGEPVSQKGYQGSVSGSVLTDNSVTILAAAGYRLKVVSAQSTGSYVVASSTSNTITTSQAFPTASTSNVAWELYQGVTPGSINPSVVADAVYEDFNHLPSEPYEVRLITAKGTATSPVSALSPVDLPTANSGRALTIRFGTTAGSDIPVTLVTSSIIGPIANGTLYVPTTAPRFTTGKFSVVVGTRVFVNGVDLMPVVAFTGNPNIIEYRTSDGMLNFGSNILADFFSTTVVYREEPLAPANMGTGQVDLSPFTGELTVNATDTIAHVGSTIYLVDLQTQDDVYLNPILGAFTFRRPLGSGQMVEATYLRAVPNSGVPYRDTDGNTVTVTELLPVYIRREAATRVNSQLYSFNSVGRTLKTSVVPSVYVGAKMVSYGTPPGVTINTSGNTFSLATPVMDPATRVLITYAVLEAVGGETSYTVSQGPVWRPPFSLTAKVKTFVLLEDRTTDMVPGKILRLGNYLTYIRSATYNATTDTTTVEVFPTPDKSVGSLAPSDPPTNVLTDRPITPTVDPAGTSPVTTTADTGFLPRLTTAYGLTSVPTFQKVTKGQSVVRFDGDVTRYAITGHVIELFGVPFLISKAEFVDGKYTDITLGSPSPSEMTWTSGMNPDYVRISVRPVYPVGSTVFVGTGPFVQTEAYEMVAFQGTDPGVTLTEGKDYQIDSKTGALTLLEPRQTGLAAHSSLRFFRTDQNTLAPFSFQGRIQYPRVAASAAYIDAPSSTNGRLGGQLTATYTFDSPDSFYTRSVPLMDYITETSSSIVRGVAANATGNNPSVGGVVTPSPSTNGRTGLTSERQDLVCRDRVTRTFLRWYNGIITSFEQVLENIDGNPVGDRDGKLRLWMGTDNPWTPPGYEDGITSAVNPRNIWSDVWNGLRTTPIALILTDPITDPSATNLDVNGNPVGTALSASALDRLMGLQPRYVKNDVDDVVLVGLRNTTLSLAGIIRFQVTSYGSYRGLSEPSAFSRLFTEKTEAFTTTNPGIGYDPATGNSGVYTFGRVTADGIQSTFGKPIAQLANPVRDNITSVQGVVVSDRRARARLVAWSPAGYTATSNVPAFIATVLPLDQFPWTPAGIPDTSRFASVSGNPSDLADLATGDATLHTPPFKAGDQVALGTPDGTVYGLGYSGTTMVVGGQNVYAGVFVKQVVQGCYVTLKTYNAAGAFIDITTANVANLVRLITAASGPSLTAGMVDPGDTLFVVPTSSAVLVGVANPPTTAQLGVYAASLPTYRTGMDVNFNGRTGELVDATLPSFLDPCPFGLKEILGQNPPPPMRPIDAMVTFTNGDTAPSDIPALQGYPRMDSGDYSLPYYSISPTELSALGALFPMGISVVTTDTVSPPVGNPPPAGYNPYTTEAAYPDEILDNAGSVSPSPTYPAVLVTSVPMDPVYSTHSGIGPLDAYDMVFVQEGTGGLPPGSTGIITVGAVNFSMWVEPPRFVGRSNTNGEFQVDIVNAQVYIENDPPNPPSHVTGMEVIEDTTVPFTVTTTFNLMGITPTDIVFDDGMGGGGLLPPVGGFNTLFNTANINTRILLKIMDDTTGAFVPGATVILDLVVPNPNITLCVFRVSGDNGTTWVPGATAWFNSQKLVVTTAVPFFNLAAFGVIPTPPVTVMPPHDFAIDVVGDGARCFSISQDRLTITGPIDVRSARARGSANPALESVQCELVSLDADTRVDTLLGPATTIPSSINHINTVNGGVPFTFLQRNFVPFNISAYQVGVFFVGTGYLRVMAFEGMSNASITGTGITLSAAPSSRTDTSGPIMLAVSYSDRIDNPGLPHTNRWGDNRFIVDPTGIPMRGSMGQVLPGDIAVVKSSNEDPATGNVILCGKAGTHLVRQVVVPGSNKEYRTASYTTPDAYGDYSGWLPFEFPTVVSVTTSDLAVSDIPALPSLIDWTGALITQTHVFPAVGRVYVVVSDTGIDSNVGATFSTAIVSATYTVLDIVNMKFTGLANYQDGLGNPITGAQFVASISVGMKVSGMTLLPVNPHGTGIPDNLPGYCNADLGNPPLSMYGIYGNGSLVVGRGTFSVAYNTGTGFLNPVGPAIIKQYVHEKVKVTVSSFAALTDPVYDEIPGAITTDLGVDFDLIHTPLGAAFTPAGARCILPRDTWTAAYAAAAGIFVEPSFPMSAPDMGAATMTVVDASNSMAPGTTGFRRLVSYISTSPGVGDAFIERSEVEIRRPRRFHDLGNTFGAALVALRYNYEIRRGIVATVTTSGGYGVLTAEPVDNEVPPDPLVSGAATQLGNFTLSDVNIHPGDEVRFLDATGNITDRAEVVVITGDLTLTLSRKLTVVPGTRFEVYLKVPPVPHEQSNEELLGFATDHVVFTRTASMVTLDGGRVMNVNELEDTSYDLSTVGIEKDDIVLVDPTGKLTTPSGPNVPVQYGRRPYGDDAVTGRVGYSVGAPAPADDNRGYYRVSVKPTTPQVSVEPMGGFAGTTDVLFGTAGNAYAVYPTIHGSTLPSGVDEGQMDLRETSPPVGTSYTTTPYSTEPFSYKVIRPTGLLSDATVELILAIRERMLSWAEEIRLVGSKYGTYYIFQRDEHIRNLGLTTDPENGLGLLTNSYMVGLVGHWDFAPYTNVRDCLAILDRRFWGLDMRLDRLTPPYGPYVAVPYTNFTGGIGRPVLPDRVDEALDGRDKLRVTRYSWLSLRVDRVKGTLETIRRFDNELPRRQAEAEQALTAVQSVEKV